jgi:hypothetical protein
METARSFASSMYGLEKHAGIAKGDQLERVGFAGHADVDVEIVHLRHLLAVVLIHQVDRLAPDHAGHHAVSRHNRDALRRRDHRINAADRIDVEKAIVGDVIDDEPDLVAVPASMMRGRPSGLRVPKTLPITSVRTLSHHGRMRSRTSFCTLCS